MLLYLYSDGFRKAIISLPGNQDQANSLYNLQQALILECFVFGDFVEADILAPFEVLLDTLVVVEELLDTLPYLEALTYTLEFPEKEDAIKIDELESLFSVLKLLPGKHKRYIKIYQVIITSWTISTVWWFSSYTLWLFHWTCLWWWRWR